MKSDRHILHCDCNSFFASVEETFNPALRQVPMSVAGDPEKRHGIILASNRLAKKQGVKTAETLWSAKRKCPELVLVPPRHNTYGEFCERINHIYEQYTPLVERFGVDESFLDVSGCLHPFGGDVLRCAHDIRTRIKREIGITVSVGVSWNKIFAKLGSDYKKPDAVTDINRENWKKICFPLPATDLFFVGKKTAQTLAKIGVHTIGDLAAMDVVLLTQWFGKTGDILHRYANGLDTSPVAAAASAHEPIKSVGNGYTFKRDLRGESDIRIGVGYLSDSVAVRLRRHGFRCRVVRVTIKDADLRSITRQTTLNAPTHLSAEISVAVLGLIAKFWSVGKPIRALTITAENLVPAEQAEEAQLTLFCGDTAHDTVREEKLEQTLDVIRVRYGSRAVMKANLLDNDLGIREKD
jgi:DNA polymerase-4